MASWTWALPKYLPLTSDIFAKTYNGVKTICSMHYCEQHISWFDIVNAKIVCHLGFEPYRDDVIKWKHFPLDWLLVREVHRWPANTSHKGQWRGALMFSLICAWINCWVITGEAIDLRRHRTHYEITLMIRTHCYGYVWTVNYNLGSLILYLMVSWSW